MRILVVNPLNTWWSYQLTLELAIKYKKQNNEIFWLNAASQGKVKYELNRSDYISPLYYRKPLKNIEKIMKSQGIEGFFELVKFCTKKFEHGFTSISDLKSFNFDGIPLGQIIYSTIAYKKGHTGFKVESILKAINYHMNYIMEIDNLFNLKIENFMPDLIITIQDRLIASSLVLAKARRKNIKTKVYYWGNSVNKLDEFSNSLYDFSEWREKVKNNYQQNPPSLSEIKNIIEKILHFTETPSHDSRSFIKGQIQGSSINEKKESYVVFFASSEHEHSPIYHNIANKFKSQYNAFESLQAICQKLNLKLVLKYHPVRKGIKYKKAKFLNDWEKVKIDSNVIQIFPDSKIDTYKLITESLVNVTWNSTVGLESIARGKNTLIVGDSAWLDIETMPFAWDENQLEKSLSFKLFKTSPEMLISWFWYLESYGENFNYVELKYFNPHISEDKILKPRRPLFVLYYLIIYYKNVRSSFRKRKVNQ